MEYSCNIYKHKRGCIYTTSDGFKYSKIRTYNNVTFLRCVLHRNFIRCHGTAKLDEFTNIIQPNGPHNHQISEYHTELYELKSKCKSAARKSQGRLSKVFRECRECKQKLEDGEYTPLQYLFALEDSNDPDINLPQQSEEILSETEESDDEETKQAFCCVCLQPSVYNIILPL